MINFPFICYISVIFQALYLRAHLWVCPSSHFYNSITVYLWWSLWYSRYVELSGDICYYENASMLKALIWTGVIDRPGNTPLSGVTDCSSRGYHVSHAFAAVICTLSYLDLHPQLLPALMYLSLYGRNMIPRTWNTPIDKLEIRPRWLSMSLIIKIH